MEIINNKDDNKELQKESLINNNSPVVVALDIGTTKIVTLVGIQNQYGKIEILAEETVPSIGVMNGGVVNIQEASKRIAQCIKGAEKKCNGEIKEVVVGIAGQYVRTFNKDIQTTIKEEEVTEKDIERMKKDVEQICQKAGEKIISIIPQDFVIDNVYGITNPIGYAGKQIKGNFHVVSVNEGIIKNILRCLSISNISVQEYFLEPIASARAVLTDEQKEAGVCLIDIGGGTTDLAIYYENIIRYSAVIPLGGNIITKDIKEVCKVTEKQAEDLKINYGYAMPTEDMKNKTFRIKTTMTNVLNGTDIPKIINAYQLCEVIKARIDEIIWIIDGHLEQSGYKDKLSAGIMLTGGGSLLKSIHNEFMSNLGIITHVGIPNQHLSTSIEKLKSPIYSTSVGLLILGFETLNQSQNNIKPEENTTNNENNDKKSNMDKKRRNIMKGIFNGIRDIFTDPEDK